ncbi:MAG: molybdate ABC transporter substrate-binding protein [Polaromonas sp.]
MSALMASVLSPRALLRRARSAASGALIALLALSGALHAEEPVRVFAAASLTNALNDIGAQWQSAGHPKPVLAYAASSALARQIEAGAPADVFASADLTWMDYLDARARLAPGTRVSLLGNTLVLIAPKDRSLPVQMREGFDIAAAFTGKLCTGEPGVVPAGIYAKQSLEALGWWTPLKGRIVGTDDVRTALVFVERGECPLGIVYATDAKVSSKVEVLARFPESTHKPIVYPFAIVKNARPEAQAFLRFVQTSPEATAIFARYGFIRLPR